MDDGEGLPPTRPASSVRSWPAKEEDVEWGALEKLRVGTSEGVP